MRSFERPIAATVGSYDGVHLGHRVLLEKTRAEAERIGGESLVITFEPHPRLALDPECGMKLLSPGEEKRRLLDQAGIDHLLIIPFDRAFSRMTPSDFLHLLVEQIGVRSLVVGYDHRFGCDKSGSHALLERLKGELGLDVTEVAEREVGDIVVFQPIGDRKYGNFEVNKFVNYNIFRKNKYKLVLTMKDKFVEKTIDKTEGIEQLNKIK